MLVLFSTYRTIIYSSRNSFDKMLESLESKVNVDDFRRTLVEWMNRVVGDEDLEWIHTHFPLKGCKCVSVLAGFLLVEIGDLRRIFSSTSKIYAEKTWDLEFNPSTFMKKALNPSSFMKRGNLSKKNKEVVEEIIKCHKGGSIRKSIKNSKLFQNSQKRVALKIKQSIKYLKKTKNKRIGKLFIVNIFDIRPFINPKEYMGEPESQGPNMSHFFNIFLSLGKGNEIVWSIYQAYGAYGVKQDKTVAEKDFYGDFGKNDIAKGFGYTLDYHIKYKLKEMNENSLMIFLKDYQQLLCFGSKFNEEIYYKLFNVKFKKNKKPKEVLTYNYCIEFDVEWDNIVSSTNYLYNNSCLVCDGCKKLIPNGTKAKRCSRCKRKYFCSVKCQRGAWKTHKKVCCKFE